MIQRYNEKLPVCSYCLKSGHSAFTCPQKPRKTLQTHKGLKVSSLFGGQRKPMRKRGKVANEWTKTRNKFIKQHDGDFTCHYCLRRLKYDEVEIDHRESRSRRPDLRYEQTNLVVSCHSCNSEKGPKSHDEVCKRC